MKNLRGFRPSIRERALGVPPASTPAPEVKKKDGWDKAAVLASVLSSVVLASLTLMLNSTIQRTQIDLQSKQMAVAQENSRREERNQNAKATTDLIQYLLSGEPAKQRIALIALRRAVQDDDDLVVNIVSVVASTSKDPSVFSAATDTLQTSHDPRVAKILSDISLAEAKEQDPHRAAVAFQASQRVGVQAVAGSGTVIIYAAPPGRVAMESIKLGGGVFTRSLIQTLDSSDPPVRSGLLDIAALSHGIMRRISTTEPNQPMPMTLDETTGPIPFWSPAHTKVLSVGIAHYTGRGLPSLRYPASDAAAFSDIMKKHGADAQLLIDADRQDVLRSIASFKNAGDGSGTFVFYFSGHGWNSGGVQQLAAADTDAPGGGLVSPTLQNTDLTPRGSTYFEQSLALEEVMNIIRGLPFRNKVVIIDACSLQTEMLR